MKKIILFIALTLLSSCASIDGPSYGEIDTSIPEGKAKIVVYRLWSATGAVYSAGFFLNGEKIANLSNGGFNYIFVDPGEYVVSHGPDKNPYHKKIEFKAHAGLSYFVGLQRGFPDQMFISTAVEDIHEFKLQTFQP